MVPVPGFAPGVRSILSRAGLHCLRRTNWWRMRALLPPPHACKARALLNELNPHENGAYFRYRVGQLRVCNPRDSLASSVGLKMVRPQNLEGGKMATGLGAAPSEWRFGVSTAC